MLTRRKTLIANKIRKESYKIYVYGLENLRGKDAKVWILSEVGILAPAGMIITVQETHEEACHIMEKRTDWLQAHCDGMQY